MSTSPLLKNENTLDIYLAPMVGLSHFALRKIVADYLRPDEEMLWPTEMLSSWRLPKENLGQTVESIKNPNEKFICPQILGNEEEPIRQSIIKLQDWGATAIDINMGCPVTKALRHNYGVALMGDPDYAAKVVEMAVRHAKVPVSVKLRAGLQNDLPFLIQFVKRLESAGAAWITLHPRVAGLKRRGRADWSQIAQVKKELHIPVVGNGDVETAEDYASMKVQTGCDGVMMGRALAAKPWLIRSILDGHPFFSTPEQESQEYGKNLIRLCDHFKAQDFSFLEMQRKLGFYVRMTHMWLDFGHQLNSLVGKAKEESELRQSLMRFFEQSLKMSQRSSLKM